jgi:peptidoglycan-associated lipoprotein
MRNAKSLAFILSSAALLAACSSPVKVSEPAPVVESKPVEAAPPAADTRNVAPVETKSIDPLDDPQGVLAQRSVYFDFDSFVVKDEFRPVVELHAKRLASQRSRKLALEGHTDERGGSEYNLALGQKRAEAVAKSLELMGAQNQQLEAVSFGKERPAVQGNDEAAWAKNRRAELNYR